MIDGNKAWEWGKFELLRMWGIIWPLVLGGLVTYLTTRAAELSEGGQATLAIVVALVAKGLQQLLTDNTGKKL